MGCFLQVSRDTLVATLRRELHESNLAVSEARSLLSAGKRQEAELRDRVNYLQRMLDNGAWSRAANIQMAAGAEQEMRVLRSQYETLQRQYKVSGPCSFSFCSKRCHYFSERPIHALPLLSAVFSRLPLEQYHCWPG